MSRDQLNAIAGGLRSRPGQQARAPRNRSFPVVLPPQQIKLMLERKLTVLVRTAFTRPGIVEVHNAAVCRRNDYRRKHGRSDEQNDPFVTAIEITQVASIDLVELDLGTVRRAGYTTLEEFFTDWARRRRRVDPTSEVLLCEFQIAAEERYLHERMHLGYTSDPGDAIAEEPGSPRAAVALTPDELDGMSTARRRHWEQERAEEIARRDARQLNRQLRELQNQALLGGVDVSSNVEVIKRQLDQMKAKLGDAA